METEQEAVYVDPMMLLTRLEHLQGEVKALTCIAAAIAIEVPTDRVTATRERIALMMGDLKTETMATDEKESQRQTTNWHLGIADVQQKLHDLFADHHPAQR